MTTLNLCTNRPAKARWQILGLYGLALLFPIATLVLRQILPMTLGGRPLLMLFILPILISALLGGFGPGLTATLSAVICTGYFLIPPRQSWVFTTHYDLMQWSLLLVNGVVVSLLSESLHRSQQRARAAYERAETALEEVHHLNAGLQQRIAEHAMELTSANQEMDALAYAIAHNLRAPVRAMNSFSQGLVEDFSNQLHGEARVYLEQVGLASHQMNELIDGLLALSRSTQGRLRREALNLSKLTERLLGELAQRDPGRQVAVEVETGLQAHGDARMIASMLRCLLDNAWKFTAHTATPHIRVYQEGPADARRFCVADNGAGFDMAHANRLFQPFQRLHRQGEFPGVGIGLATAQRIIHRHGGTIKARGAPDQGAVFCFTLPGGSEMEPRSTR